jgi:hypothetical protein
MFAEHLFENFEKLSEKGCEQRSERRVGRFREAKMGQEYSFVALQATLQARTSHFSGSFSMQLGE